MKWYCKKSWGWRWMKAAYEESKWPKEKRTNRTTVHKLKNGKCTNSTIHDSWTEHIDMHVHLQCEQIYSAFSIQSESAFGNWNSSMGYFGEQHLMTYEVTVLYFHSIVIICTDILPTVANLFNAAAVAAATTSHWVKKKSSSFECDVKHSKNKLFYFYHGIHDFLNVHCASWHCMLLHSVLLHLPSFFDAIYRAVFTTNQVRYECNDQWNSIWIFWFQVDCHYQRNPIIWLNIRLLKPNKF